MDNLCAALSSAKLAVSLDQKGDTKQALERYKQTAAMITEALQTEITNSKLKLEYCEQLAHYMSRIEELTRNQSAFDERVDADKAIDSNPQISACTSAPAQAQVSEDDAQIIARIEALIMTDKPTVGFNGVFGLEAEKKSLEQAIILPIKFPELFSDGLEPYKGFLFFGPPGTGKTHIARAVAAEAENSTFFTVSASDLISKWQGESENTIKQLFRVARLKKPSIIFIDEIDSLVLTRSSDEGDATRRIKTELFVQMDGAATDNTGIFIMGATNTPQNLDEAILRRFDKLVYVPLPCIQARKSMLSDQLLGNSSTITTSDIDELASKLDGFTGSEIKTICKNARLEAIGKLQDSTHFRAVKMADGEYFEPCSENQLGALRLNLKEVPKNKILYKRIVTKEDAFSAVRQAKPRIDKSSVRKLEEFARERGDTFRRSEEPTKTKKKKSKLSKVSSVLGSILLNAID